MREILFRGQDAESGEWVYGSLLIQSGEWISKDELTPTEYRILGCRGENDLVIPETVGQYTGLTDKNKTKIFENDILSAHPDELFPNDEIRLIVVWHDYGWFGKDSKGGFISLESKWVNELFEVVGNKFDNPELLKGE